MNEIEWLDEIEEIKLKKVSNNRCPECGKDMDSIHALYCSTGKAKATYEGWCRYNG